MALYTARISSEALAAATAETLVQVVAASSKPLRIIELGISFDGVTAGAVPVTVDLMRQTTAGTASALTLVEEDSRLESPLATALQDFTAEPTAGDVLRSWFVTPAGGLFVMQFPQGREPVAPESTRIGLRATAPAIVNAIAYITFEE